MCVRPEVAQTGLRPSGLNVKQHVSVESFIGICKLLKNGDYINAGSRVHNSREININSNVCGCIAID